MEPIKLIVGLGNPGSDYARTRHNAGFWFVDALCEAWGGTFKSSRKLRAELAEVSIAGNAVKLLKPQTFMNLSGESVVAALNYYKLPSEAMLVAYDEIDFEPGKLRLRFGGGHAGHNGIRNIIAHAGADFWRMRFGVGHPGDSSRVKGHVLRKASTSDERLIMDTIMRGIESIPVLLRDGPERAQQQLHTETGVGN
jgi:PTH1 family peptidyl-tRNA hydrolase